MGSVVKSFFSHFCFCVSRFWSHFGLPSYAGIAGSIHTFFVQIYDKLIHLGGAGSFLGKSAVTPDPSVASMASKGLATMLAARRRLSITTWNVAAINNNPFEYWITVPDHPDYEKLMVDIEQFIDHPSADQDVTVQQVFTQSMFEKLDQRFVNVGWKSMKSCWEEDYSKRKIISEFLKVCNTRERVRCFWLFAILTMRSRTALCHFDSLPLPSPRFRMPRWGISDWHPCQIESPTPSMSTAGPIQFVDQPSSTCTTAI